MLLTLIFSGCSNVEFNDVGFLPSSSSSSSIQSQEDSSGNGFKLDLSLKSKTNKIIVNTNEDNIQYFDNVKKYDLLIKNEGNDNLTLKAKNFNIETQHCIDENYYITKNSINKLKQKIFDGKSEIILKPKITLPIKNFIIEFDKDLLKKCSLIENINLYIKVEYSKKNIFSGQISIKENEGEEYEITIKNIPQSDSIKISSINIDKKLDGRFQIKIYPTFYNNHINDFYKIENFNFHLGEISLSNCDLINTEKISEIIYIDSKKIKTNENEKPYFKCEISKLQGGDSLLKGNIDFIHSLKIENKLEIN